MNNIEAIKSVIEREGVIFLTYTGFLSQSLIAAITDALEKEAESGRLKSSEATNVYTVFIEMAQNIMNYSRTPWSGSDDKKPEGIILVGFSEKDQHFYIQSQNIVLSQEKSIIESKLLEIQNLSLDDIKTRYRELRRSGRNMHGKGGGIGFFEIAKRCEKLSYIFKDVGSGKYSFQLTANIVKKNNGENYGRPIS